jgi:hypothetical protein
MPVKLNWDAAGIATSILCAIHCALLPLVLTSLPLMGLNIIHNGTFEWVMIGLAFLIGAYSLSHGYRKHHHSLKPIGLFAFGFFFLAAKQFTTYHLVFLSIAVIGMISAHYLNFRLCHKSKCADPHHSH